MPKRFRRSLKLGVPLNIVELSQIRRAAGSGSVAAWARAALVAASVTEDPTPIRGNAPKQRKGTP